jgi:hypothetical protein
MSKEQIILDVYREHCLEQSKYLRHGGTIQEFIDKCKTNPEFSEKWGLKIEELELSWEERFELFKKQNNGSHPYDNEMLDDYNIPTKLITITYNDKTIESYE